MAEVVHTLTQPLQDSLDYLAEVVRTRLTLHFNGSASYGDIREVPFPNFNGVVTPYLQFLIDNELGAEELIILLMAFAPHVKPQFFDEMIAEYLPNAGDFPQLGGVRGKQHRGFLPTGETALFILSGDDLGHRFYVQRLFDTMHRFSRWQILHLEEPEAGEPAMSGKLVLSQEYVDLFTMGQISKPRFSTTFPAQLITTDMEWEDLVLNENTMSQIQELENWIQHADTLLYEWGMKKKLKKGFRVLFHGPPGTGKTLTASLLGKYTNKDVYRVDLSMVVSKFIGETEKNLAHLFNKAEHKGWILFFDEADALFGKRTNVRDAHDKYANQEVSYLLQRVENYDGLVVLASNFKSNIDEAFMRRFQSVIHFPFPKFNERFQLWKKAFPENIELEALDLSMISRKYELTGANIMNVVQFACLRCLKRGDTIIREQDLVDGIRKEFSKEGKLG